MGNDYQSRRRLSTVRQWRRTNPSTAKDSALTKPILYGVSISRALRSIWAIEEVGIDYEHVPTHFFKDTKTPEFLSINPNGRVPTLVDGDLMLCESMAINLYLAERYGNGLWPDSIEDRARTQQLRASARSQLQRDSQTHCWLRCACASSLHSNVNKPTRQAAAVSH